MRTQVVVVLALIVVFSVIAGTLAVVYLKRRHVIVTVRGASMLPTYESGDRVLIRRGGRAPMRGEVVVVRKPDVAFGWPSAVPVAARRRPLGRRWIIKRVVAVGGDPWPGEVGRVARGETDLVPTGHVVLLGDGTESLDSRRWGSCPEHQILGRVMRRMP